jgi:holo-[acyl-carrier protein] synthase
MNINSSFIKGLGNDILEVDRLQKAIDRHGHHIIDKIFTLREQDYCLKFSNPSERFAGRFAAKEAIAKALGTGISKEVNWKEIEIVNDSENGKPYAILSDRIKKKFHNPTIHISLSHTSTYASAVAIWTS